MQRRELLRKIRKIEIVTERLVRDRMAGQYHSVFKGSGIAFSEVRQYMPGDDIRLIDWNVSARMNDVYVKLFTEEREIMNRMTSPIPAVASPVSSPAEILSARKVISQVYLDDKIGDYIVNIVHATREPKAHGLGQLADFISFGASPRASIYLNLAARAHAFLRHRGYVTPEDIKAIGVDVLRHRVILTYEAEAEEMTSEDIIRRLFERVEVP